MLSVFTQIFIIQMSLFISFCLMFLHKTNNPLCTHTLVQYIVLCPVPLTSVAL